MFDDWMDRYGFIIELGRKLPPFPAEWQDDAHRVPGCQSKVWMEAAMRDGRMFLAGASDAAIVSGLVALLLRVYSGRTPAEVLATDPAFLKDLGLLGHCPATAAAASPPWPRASATSRKPAPSPPDPAFPVLTAAASAMCWPRSSPPARSTPPICRCGSPTAG